MLDIMLYYIIIIIFFFLFHFLFSEINSLLYKNLKETYCHIFICECKLKHSLSKISLEKRFFWSHYIFLQLFTKRPRSYWKILKYVSFEVITHFLQLFTKRLISYWKILKYIWNNKWSEINCDAVQYQNSACGWQISADTKALYYSINRMFIVTLLPIYLNM